jgi:hypothetical protein
MLGAGMVPSGKPVITDSITAPPKGPTFQFGEYILSYTAMKSAKNAVASDRTKGDEELAAIYEKLTHLPGS